MALPKIEVCLSPALLHLFDTQHSVVVIIDVFRATTTIAAALHHGAKEVIPVAQVEECIALGKTLNHSITAGERDGQVAPGLQHGNSPLEYPPSFVANQSLILTTTNGTKLLHMVKEYEAIITGAFVNLDAVCSYLIKQNKNVLLACAAWKDRVNLEDTLFAGAVIHQIQEGFSILCDSAVMAHRSYTDALRYPSLLEYLKAGNHYRRLSGFGLHEDLKHCTTPNLHPVVPIYKDHKLIIEQ